MAEKRRDIETEWHPRDYVDEVEWEAEEIEHVAKYAQICWRSPPLSEAQLRDLVGWCRREVERRYRRVVIFRYHRASGSWEEVLSGRVDLTTGLIESSEDESDLALPDREQLYGEIECDILATKKCEGLVAPAGAWYKWRLEDLRWD